MPRPCPLGDLASSLVHLQRFCTRLRKVWRHKGPNSCELSLSQASKQWAGKLSDEARWDGHVDGSIREGAAILPFCSMGAAHPCTSTYTNVREADSGRGTFKKQTLKKSIVSCQISFLSWLPRARDKQQAGPNGEARSGWQEQRLAAGQCRGAGVRMPWPSGKLSHTPPAPISQRAQACPRSSPEGGESAKKWTAVRETLSHLGW